MFRTFKTSFPLRPHHQGLHLHVIDKTTGQILCDILSSVIKVEKKKLPEGHTKLSSLYSSFILKKKKKKLSRDKKQEHTYSFQKASVLLINVKVLCP